MYFVLQKTPAKARAALGAAATTGHVASPATIVIGKKSRAASTPKPKPKKGRKSVAPKVRFHLFHL